MAEQDATEKMLESYADVFADIVNVLLFQGRHFKGCLDIPRELEPYVSDYRVNLFEIAWLPDETVNMFQSDCDGLVIM